MSVLCPLALISVYNCRSGAIAFADSLSAYRTCHAIRGRTTKLHRGDGRGKTFSVHLEQNVFHCFDAACGKKGDVIDLWASVNGMSLRQAALDLARTFNLEPAPGTEKRNG